LIYEAPVGPASSNPPNTVTFTTQEEKTKAVHKTLGELVNKYPGTDEAAIATYYLGAYSSDQGNLGEAEKDFKQVIDSGKREYASLAKLSLAKVYQSQGKTADAEKLLRSLVANPTILVSKQQATIALAEALAPTKPEEARKLLEPLRADRSPVSRAALNVLARIPNNK
jgi:predicted negative regulator of RcsB-dependent stress response